MDDGGGGEEGSHRPECDEPVRVEAGVRHEEPDDENTGRDGAPDRRGQGHVGLGRRPGEPPLDDREGDERRAEELRVNRRLGERQAEELVEPVPRRGEQEGR